ncbi:hypothetical protein HanPSC8_Chr15g0672051 [Helianthus annuus]|nr:hypothetical protein HanPSC8_Chr15g0672051 [Helianthus annuus]
MVVTVVVGPSTDNTFDSHNTPTNTEHQELQFIRFVTKGTITTSTPNGTPYLIPDVDAEYIPIINSTFNSWEYVDSNDTDEDVDDDAKDPAYIYEPE